MLGSWSSTIESNGLWFCSPGRSEFDTNKIWLERASSTGKFCLGPGRERYRELRRARSSIAHREPSTFRASGEPTEGALHVSEKFHVAARIIARRLSSDPQKPERLCGPW